MLDTVKLTRQNTPEEAIKPHERWQLHTSSSGEIIKQEAVIKLNETPEYDTFGQKQKQLYNGTIKLTYDNTGRFLNIGCSSLPALFHATSMRTLTSGEMANVTDAIWTHISPLVDVSPEETFFTRMDNSTVYPMDSAPANYINLLDAITRSKQHRHAKNYHQGETIQFRNNKRTVGFYNKYAKNIKNPIERQYMATMEAAANSLRYEIQHKTASEIRKAFNTTNVRPSDLKEAWLQDRLMAERLTLFDKLFPFQTEEQIRQQHFFSLLDELSKLNGKQSALNDAALYVLIQQYGMDTIKKGVELIGISRQAIHNRVKKLTALHALEAPNIELYEELKQKIKTAA